MSPGAIAAKPEPVDEFPPNPLELRQPDPFLPSGVPPRALTAAEQKALRVALDALTAEATAQLKRGNRNGAFDTWNRELRLRRVLGLLPELEGLGRIGAIAWQENQTPQLRWITQRLDAILTQTKPPTQPDKSAPVAAAPLQGATRIAVLEALGTAYQQVRSPANAILVYQQVLADARERKDTAKIDTTLNTLGTLHLDWFDYPEAAATYRELLERAQAANDRPRRLFYLTQLAYVHEQAKQPDQAIPYQQQLVELYQAANTLETVPALKIRLADNYQQAAQLSNAERTYQEAYQLAQTLTQFGYASEALQKLGILYRANNRPDAAVRVYDFLVAIEQQAYNVYGMMNAYDQIGQIELARNARPQALNAFQRGLALARQLKYREDYFKTQIQQVSQSGNR